MFDKILIANRGEIACRIIKTARRMGIATVAVYSDADRDALHVRMADEAASIGPAPATQSYLVIEHILDACRRTGAQAVHPGYGFLSERAAFAQALQDGGVTFIGPSPHAIAAMGDKIESKKFANAAGVSTVPGFLGVIESADHASSVADAIGYPVMLKASAGGGGKGMRVAWSRDEVAEAFARATSEARAAFGDERVLIEKYIVNPRHIEIQVLGDKHGQLIYLGERECSIQRRNQKVVEEAPSPLIDPATRLRMGEQAIALARAVGYDSAGTVEFVAAQDKTFYFLEMNTRLQVEHPVTELVTGVDLVEQMIRIAAGEPLAVKQSDVRLTGWAVESRIYAEDPTRNFLPSTGRLVTYQPPTEGRENGVSVRNDAGVFEGGEVSIHYDPMIAKLVTHAGDRIGAIEAQVAALDSFVIEGLRHNIAFLSSLMQNPRWREARLSTGFLAEEYPDGFAPHAPEGAEADLFACVAAAVDHTLNTRKRQISGQLPTSRPVVFERERVVMLGSRRIDLTIERSDGDLLMRTAQDCAHRVQSAWTPGGALWRGTIDDEDVLVKVRPILNGVALARRGASVEARVYTRREAELAQRLPPKVRAQASKALLCPMPGLVRAIFVAPGQAVAAGEALCMVEAMKMENVLGAERDAIVARVLCSVGDAVAVDAVLIEFA